MNNDYIQSLFAQRIGGSSFGETTQIYKFEKIKRAKRSAKEKNPHIELLDFGVGEPDEPATAETVMVLAKEAAKAENRFYADNGGQLLKEAAARYMKRICGVEVDPQSEIIHSIGIKAALSILPAALIDPGDYVLMTVPGYPVFGTHAQYYGGKVYNLPLKKENQFLPDLYSVPQNILSKTKVLVLNYPNNPTGAVASRGFFEDVVDFALKHRIVVIHDFAYAGLVFEGKPLSFLSIPGAKEVGIELHSASKNFNMTGWRCGFVVGNPKLIKAYGYVKDHTDSGQFLAIQHAYAYCLDHSEITERIAQKYSRRMDLMVETLRNIGFKATKPKASFFLYTEAPKSVNSKGKNITFRNAEDCTQWLIQEKLISTVPWDDAGPFLRWSVTYSAKNEQEEKEIMEKLKTRLSDCHWEW
ncbi:LL-diaminopimelate aminotransferase [Methylacidiphilum caldifontis]|uniref:Aspartate aminotransferase n=1 Tax=Methylacidiphilum caldifontis TaxID=2795386 RepID=A0A4Y8PF16_9BACT|nr:LL-diaminopimelate aminotransferase [Methylacidiphilum caldifontis]QSR88240.1 LL-diaminopimelate aminotransferase [Methylacidiphilum caldifontis]TFE70556.1 aspartate aminotransferase [Methylacidiphilum caldifontis]